uniref:Uncharacterized protein n=1 Tax=Glycine max TaxID=3847 RepID=A0A0R0EKE8_SOYBN
MSKEANKEEGAHSVSIDLEEISTTKKKTCKSRNGEKEGIVASMSEVASFCRSSSVEVDIKKQMVMKEVEEMIEEVQNELKNVSYLESGLRHEAINWLTENPNKLAILKSLPLDENEE